MKIKFLGTAAAEGVPGMFCNCDVCRHALKERGKNIRTRSQAIVDDKLLIDFPADTYMHILHGGLDLRDIHTCIITHNHMDHLYERDFWCRMPGIAHNIDETPFTVYVTKPGYDQTVYEIGHPDYDAKPGRVGAKCVTAFEPFSADGYEITPLKADHAQKCEPVFYIIEKDGKTLLYANDTGNFPEETWQYLEKCGKKFDLISLDCTCMLRKDLYKSGGHMTIWDNVDVVEKLRDMGLCDDKTVVVVNHFSHNAIAPHEKMVEEAAKYGFLVSYDGMEIEF